MLNVMSLKHCVISTIAMLYKCWIKLFCVCVIHEYWGFGFIFKFRFSSVQLFTCLLLLHYRQFCSIANRLMLYHLNLWSWHHISTLIHCFITHFSSSINADFIIWSLLHWCDSDSIPVISLFTWYISLFTCF